MWTQPWSTSLNTPEFTLFRRLINITLLPAFLLNFIYFLSLSEMEKKEEYVANWDVNRTDLDEINAKIEESKQYVTDREEMEKNASKKPKIAMAWPLRVWLKKGKTYFYCTWGKSKLQPFWDGESHEGTEFLPLKSECKVQVKFQSWCGCKRNWARAGPRCDGMHTCITDW